MYNLNGQSFLSFVKLAWISMKHTFLLEKWKTKQELRASAQQGQVLLFSWLVSPVVSQ